MAGSVDSQWSRTSKRVFPCVNAMRLLSSDENEDEDEDEDLLPMMSLFLSSSKVALIDENGCVLVPHGRQ